MLLRKHLKKLTNIYFFVTPRVIIENTLSAEAETQNVKKHIGFLNSNGDFSSQKKLRSQHLLVYNTFLLISQNESRILYLFVKILKKPLS